MLNHHAPSAPKLNADQVSPTILCTDLSDIIMIFTDSQYLTQPIIDHVTYDVNFLLKVSPLLIAAWEKVMCMAYHTKYEICTCRNCVYIIEMQTIILVISTITKHSFTT